MTENGSTRLLKWKLTFSGLTGKAIGAHVHKGKAGVAGAVLVPLCGPCTSGKTGQVKISKDVADLFERDLVYVNVHTNKNPAGEIRGQLKLVGEHESAAGTGASTQPGTTAAGHDHRRRVLPRLLNAVISAASLSQSPTE